MGLIERVIRALIYLCVLALAYYLVLWVLASIGIIIPIMVAHIIAVIIVLVAVLVLVRLFAGSFGPIRWFP